MALELWSFVTINLYMMGLRCMNYYVRARENCAAGDKMKAQHWQIQACIGLGLLLFQVNHLTDPRLGGSSYWPRGAILSTQLQYRMTHAVKGAAPADASALSFAAWTGATWARKEAFETPESYFYQTCMSLLLILGLDNWNEMAAVIDRFVPAIMINHGQHIDVHEAIASQPVLYSSLENRSLRIARLNPDRRLGSQVDIPRGVRSSMKR